MTTVELAARRRRYRFHSRRVGGATGVEPFGFEGVPRGLGGGQPVIGTDLATAG